MAQPQQQDPWAQAAQAYNQGKTPTIHLETTKGGKATQPYAEGVSSPPNGGDVTDVNNPSGDWKVWQAQDGDAAPPQTMMQYIGGRARDLAKGVGEGVLNTVSGSDAWAREHLPAFMTNSDFGFGPPANLQRLRALGAPANTTQQVGKGLEQAAEFMVPGSAEESIGEHIAPFLSKLPYLAEKAPTIARVASRGLLKSVEEAGKVAPEAVGSGIVNKAQGGTFGGGATAGATGAMVGAGLKKIAPVLAETALNVRGADRAYGRTPGQAILDETTGFSPRRIANQASDKVDALSNQLEDIARDSETPASLGPAREAATESINAAYGRNNKATYDKLLKMGRQLDTDLEGNEIPEVTSPQRLLHLKRGIGDLQTSWNPATQPKWVNGQVGHVYHALDSEFDRAVPQGAALNQRISTLLPIQQRANAADLNAGFLQRSLGRFGAHTGALTGAGIGGAFGYKEDGLPGAIAGASLGVLAPEALASPEVQMMGARAVNSRAARRAIPVIEGGALQFTRKSPFADPDERR